MAAGINRAGMTEADLVAKRAAYANVVATLETRETPFLSMVSPGLNNLIPDMYGQRTHKWLERVRKPNQTTLNGDVAQSATTVVLTDKVCRPGDHILVGNEVIQLVTSSDYLTFTSCVRSIFTGADVAHTSGDDVFVFGTSYAEAQNFPVAGEQFQPSEITSYTDILMDSFKFSGSALGVQQYAIDDDKVVAESFDVALRLKKQLEQRVLWSGATSPSGSSTAGQMLGLYERVGATNYINCSSSMLDYPNLQKAVRNCQRRGALSSGSAALFCSDEVAHAVDQWVLGKVQFQASEAARALYGANARAIQVGEVVVDIVRANQAGFLKEACLVSLDNVKVGPKDASRVFHIEQEGKTGDYSKFSVIGEYACQVMLPYSHCWITGLPYSA